MRIEPLREATPGYLEMRRDLWSENADEHEREVEWMVARPARWGLFVAFSADGSAIGFAEAGLREYAESATTSPVGYLEGIYVRPQWRGLGVARALIAAAEGWARERGCTEMASDTELSNVGSQRMHERLGFREVERQVCFLKELR